MNLLFIGDPHGALPSIGKYVLRHRPKGIVLLGDIEPAVPLDRELAGVLDAGIEVGWLHGNHDVDGTEEMWLDLVDPTRNPRTSPRALHGRMIEIAGIRIAGLGGIFREAVWHPGSGKPATYRSFAEMVEREKRLRPQFAAQRILTYRATIFPDVYEAMWDLQADVLATHEAPSSHAYGFVELDDLARAIGARMIYHGHHHEAYRSRHVDGDLEVVGVGLAAAVDEDGNVVEEGSERSRPARLNESVQWQRVR